MTQPGAPAPDAVPPPHVPDIRRQAQPQQAVAPPWPVQPGPVPPRFQERPPSAPHTDSTRTIAIVALVLSGVTMLGVVVATIAPLLLFGALTVGAGAVFGDVVDEGPLTSSNASYSGGEVTPAADGSVAGSTLATAVVELVADGGQAGRVTCDPVVHVGDDVSVLCRATDPTWFGIVRFSGSDGSFEVITTGGPDGSFGPDGPMP